MNKERRYSDAFHDAITTVKKTKRGILACHTMAMLARSYGLKEPDRTQFYYDLITIRDKAVSTVIKEAALVVDNDPEILRYVRSVL